MILAKLKGRKSQTRRIINMRSGRMNPFFKDEGRGVAFIQSPDDEVCSEIKAPRGTIGDRQYWQEAFDFSISNFPMIRYKADGVIEPLKLSQRDSELFGRWKWPKEGQSRGMAAMFMLRSMSRGLDEITDLRVERVQEISKEDAIEEGLKAISKDYGTTLKWGIPDRDGLPGTGDHGWAWQEFCKDPRDAYRKLWDSINAKCGYSWADNPYCWVYTTKTF